MNKIHLLVEGQSEEIVVREVLAPHLESLGLYLKAVVVRTKREKSGTTFKGGIVSFAKIERELKALLADTSVAAVTTFLDYYGLPHDFPGTDDRPPGDAYRRVAHVERAFAARINDRRFIPHLTLHELEAWVYADPATAAWVFTERSVAQKLDDIRKQCGGAELIDEDPETAPSKRILKLAPDYAKTVAGPQAIEAIGLEKIRKACPHANGWLKAIEALAP